MRVRIAAPGGMFPRRDPRLLEAHQAQLARGTRLLAGVVEPYLEPQVVQEGVGIPGVGVQSIWRWRSGGDAFWFRFPSVVDAVRGPTAGDVWERVYWTGDSRYGKPMYTHAGPATSGGGAAPVNAFPLGVEEPSQAITATVIAPDPFTITAVQMNRPIKVVTAQPHDLETGNLVRFSITSQPPEDDAVRDLAEFANFEGGLQITVTSPTEFTVDGTDAVNQQYSAFISGTGVKHYDPGLIDGRYYTHTYVTDLGEEGPPADPSALINAGEGQAVVLSLPQVSFTSGMPITHRRIYRTATGMLGADFQFVAQVPIEQDEYTDTLETRNLAEVIPSTRYDPPPQGLMGLDVLPGGSLVGFVNQDVCFSEPYKPHAWPTDYRLSLDYPVVALGVFDQYVVAATQARPYIISGADPRAMQPQRLPLTQACVSKRSMVSMGYGCIYASADGLVLVDASGARVVTRDVLTPREWQEYAPTTIHAYEQDGRYMAFFDNGTRKAGFVFDPREPAAGFGEIDTWAKAGYRDPMEPHLYLLTEDDNIARWDAGDTPKPYLWRSRQFPFTYPVNMSCARVIARSYDNTTLRLYAGGTLRAERPVHSDEVIVLPGGYQANDCVIEIEGTDAVQEIVVADELEDLLRP